MLRTRSIWPLILLPVFFILHGYTEFYPIIPLLDSLELLALYLLAGFAIALLSWLLFKSWPKAYQFAFLALAINFFFGAVQDSLLHNLPGSWINKYSILLSIVLILLVAFGIFLKKERGSNPKTISFVCLVFITLILFDLGTKFISEKSLIESKSTIEFRQNIKIPKDSLPDIHLIIADEYPGRLTFEQYLHHSNDSFLTELKSRGFYVADQASSNYNFTEFSTASLLNMDYLKKIEGRDVSLHHLGYCFETIKGSPFIHYLKSMGYDFNNHSIFDFLGHPSPVIPTLLPGRTKPITEQTLISRVRKDLGYHFYTDLPLMSDWFDLAGSNLRNNNKIYQLTVEKASNTHLSPTFTYTHLLMPHTPYYYKANGEIRPRSEWGRRDDQALLEYVQYANQQLIKLVDSIRLKSTRPVAIVLIGDHGLRTYSKPVSQINYFNTLVSVLLPNKKYDRFYPTISHVNLLRTTVNSIFNEQLPLLNDSTIFLRE
jgi:hypothetical protein